LEAIDLVLGPDRLSRRPPIDEHDFHLGNYLPPTSTREMDAPSTLGFPMWGIRKLSSISSGAS
jgi:hypothetical protein